MLVSWAFRCEHSDWQVPELFRKRGPLYGVLQPCGMGSAVEGPAVVGDIDALYHNRKHSNGFLASKVKIDENGHELHSLIVKDAAQGWMSEPVPVDASQDEVRAVPGRGVAQFRADGTTKVRAVFDYSWCAPGPESEAKRLPRKVAKEQQHIAGRLE